MERFVIQITFSCTSSVDTQNTEIKKSRFNIILEFRRRKKKPYPSTIPTEKSRVKMIHPWKVLGATSDGSTIIAYVQSLSSKNYHFRKRNFQGASIFENDFSRTQRVNDDGHLWERKSPSKNFFSLSVENSTKIFDKLKFRTKSQMQSAKKARSANWKAFRRLLSRNGGVDKHTTIATDTTVRRFSRSSISLAATHSEN